jgi:predicted short-subunit dehydrogenase-like oxidoreductase (DUF2520 family)
MKIVILGAGNVATHLTRALHDAGHEILAVYSRTLAHASEVATPIGAVATSCVKSLPSAEAYILSVKDDALPMLLSELIDAHPEALCLHTAGSIPLSVYEGIVSRGGVLYPMQTFSKSVPVEFQKLPLYIEATDGETLAVVRKIALSLSENVTELSSADRKYLHLAAVFACNFTNHCYALAEDIMAKVNLPFTDLLPLIQATTQKMNTTPPAKGQTGPAVRRDFSVMSAQAALLSDDELKQSIYKLLSESIMRKASEDTEA